MARKSTSLKVDVELWKEVKKAAIDSEKEISDFFDEALREKLHKNRLKKRLSHP